MQPEYPELNPPGPDQAAPEGNETQQVQPEAERMPSPEELLRQAELLATEHHDAWLRAKAETENVRRRAQEDIAKAHKFGIEKFAADLLAVKDSLEAALAVENATVESYRSGVEVTLKQLEQVFERQSLKTVDPAGQKFDPHQHQAISMLPSDQEPNTVINVLQKGYVLHDRVIRPALVTVAQVKGA
jgi:Molecular chaperone GrpE (heat shock protein)